MTYAEDADQINEPEGAEPPGPRVIFQVTTGRTYRGALVDTLSGEGQTDGLLLVALDGDDTVTNFYERHIVWLRRVRS